MKKSFIKANARCSSSNKVVIQRAGENQWTDNSIEGFLQVNKKKR